MGTKRENTLVVDFSILPKRPEPAAAERFIFGELKLDLADVTNIQFHNVRNVVFIEMVDEMTAVLYHNNHHLRRTMKVDKQEFKIPVYVEDDAINVRVHDLPPRTPNTVLKEHMKQFGTVLSISREVWKNYFPGVFNGVRVVRMELTKPIPSYQTIDGEMTLVTYRNQTKTCRFCGNRSHPGQKCGSSTASANDTTNTHSVTFAATDFPALDVDQHKQQKQQQMKQQKQQQTKQQAPAEDRNTQIRQQSQSSGNTNTDDVEAVDIHSDSDECLANSNKRRLSTKRDGKDGNELKRTNVSQGSQNDDRKTTEEMNKTCNESSRSVSPVNTRSRNKQSGKIV